MLSTYCSKNINYTLALSKALLVFCEQIYIIYTYFCQWATTTTIYTLYIFKYNTTVYNVNNFKL